VISEQRLRELEVALDDLGRTTGRAEDFRQLIAAARVANAAARVEREERDAKGRRSAGQDQHQGPDDPQYHVDRARADLARALRHYTDQKVTA
jgi:hypothetical protein